MSRKGRYSCSLVLNITMRALMPLVVGASITLSMPQTIDLYVDPAVNSGNGVRSHCVILN